MCSREIESQNILIGLVIIPRHRVGAPLAHADVVPPAVARDRKRIRRRVICHGIAEAVRRKAERGEKELTQAALKAIAKATGVTQKSLLEAPKGGTSSTKKTATSTQKTSSTKKTTSTSTTTTKTTAVELTSAEKTLINAYRKASAEKQKAALSLLKGEKEEDVVSSLLAGAMDLLGSLGKK